MISLNLSVSLNPGPLHKTRIRRSALLFNDNKPINFRYPLPLGLSPIPNLQTRAAEKPLLSFKNLEYSFGFSRKPKSIAASGSSNPNLDGDYEKYDLDKAAKKKDKRANTLQLGLVFGLWYFQNFFFNVFNKSILNVFPFPWLLASFQLFTGSIWMLILWYLKLQPCPKLSKPFITSLLGPAMFHTIAHISACVSYSKVAGSFTHVIKSAEPLFSVVFSSLLGDQYPLAVWLSILPIIMGCSLAAVTEVSFNLGGSSGAMISNVCFVLRNIYSKRSLQSFKEIDGLNLYGCISIISLLYLFPVAIIVEGSHWVPGYHKAIASVGKLPTLYFWVPGFYHEAIAIAGKTISYLWVLLSCVFYHLYNQSSYQLLDKISPLTFSVWNTMKRVVVIVSMVLVFRNPVRPQSALGSAIAIFGTFLYSQANAKKGKSEEGGDKN